MGWIWIVVIVGSLIAGAALVDRRRYRGLVVSPELSGKAKRQAIRDARARMAHLETPARDTGYTSGGGDVSGGGGD